MNGFYFMALSRYQIQSKLKFAKLKVVPWHLCLVNVTQSS